MIRAERVRERDETHVADGVCDVAVFDASNKEIGARVVVLEVEADLVDLVLDDLRDERSENGGDYSRGEKDGRELHGSIDVFA